MEEKNNKKMKQLNEVVDINENKVFIEYGEVKTILSEAIQQRGYMSVEENRKITIEVVRKT